MIDITEALKTLRPRAEWVIRGDELEWLDAIQSEPTQAEIDAEITRLQTEYDSLAYARSRKQEYDKLNQWEMHFDDQRDGTSTWVDSINEIKNKFPKE
jgi:hypothetical protein